MTMGDASHAAAESTREGHPGDQHEIPVYEAHTSSNSLKDRIRLHYELASDYYYSLWYSDSFIHLSVPPSLPLRLSQGPTYPPWTLQVSK